MKTPTPAHLNRQQVKHLTDRLLRTSSAANRRRYVESPKPIEVVRAEKTIERYQATLAKKAEAEREKMIEERERCEELMLFAEPNKALAAVIAFERKYGPKGV